MVTLDWLLLTTLPLAPLPCAHQAGAPGAQVTPVFATAAAELTRNVWQAEFIKREQENEQQQEGSGGAMPPGAEDGTPIVYQSGTLLGLTSTVPPVPEAELRLSLSQPERGQAVFMDDLTIPTPGELFTAISRGQRPNWQRLYRAPGAMVYRNRPQMALNIGIIIADAYMAVEARDTMQCLAMTQDLLTLATGLGMTPAQLARGQVLQSFAQEGRWPVMRSEFEAMENEIKEVLRQQRDNSLVDVLSLGCWLRTLEISSAVLQEYYSPERAAIIRQPELIFWLRERATTLAPRVDQENIIGRMKECLKDIEPLLVFDARKPPTQIECEKLNRLLGRFLKRAVSK